MRLLPAKERVHKIGKEFFMVKFSRTIDVFEFNSNLGLREQRGKQPYVKNFPSWLKQYGFYDLIKPRKIIKLIPPDYQMKFDSHSGILNENAVLDYALNQKKILQNE